MKFSLVGGSSIARFFQTIGVDFGVKQIKIPDTDCIVEVFLFDCPGQGVFNKLEQASQAYTQTQENRLQRV